MRLGAQEGWGWWHFQKTCSAARTACEDDKPRKSVSRISGGDKVGTNIRWSHCDLMSVKCLPLCWNERLLHNAVLFFEFDTFFTKVVNGGYTRAPAKLRIPRPRCVYDGSSVWKRHHRKVAKGSREATLGWKTTVTEAAKHWTPSETRLPIGTTYQVPQFLILIRFMSLVFD